ncbi:winged helix-turn-helix transcriptional regulator [Lentzea tibetensis]|uniref:Winged helix-turn-helix transcriptional regulator n=1 Tax=Lentzea tibetensis TaxID=2591470 RepID=A0A563EW33_9PSEU|nr:MarR family winged helix-turn-helix transcriptional regulator [Lentzea tibetensis]TWP51915.1 winged helix-turn-helix transcriptional regulator [Lentzea tibetensis]
MDVTLVEGVRRFNRTVTQRIGALDDAFLSRDRPLGQARLLWEIGADGCEVRELRSRLELDSGYLSRMLRGLETAGLVVVDTGGADARVRTARLTAAGLAERAELDRRADALAASILQPLNAGQRDRLVAAMAEVERLLVASMVDVAVVDERHPDAAHCIESYFAELTQRFGFDPARTIPADLTAYLVATLHGEPVGGAGLKLVDAGVGEVKRMWVSASVRGLGLGRRLLAEVEAAARGRGVRVVRLETNRTLVEAIALYLAAGYREVGAFNDEPYAHHWFEKVLEA